MFLPIEKNELPICIPKNFQISEKMLITRVFFVIFKVLRKKP